MKQVPADSRVRTAIFECACEVVETLDAKEVINRNSLERYSKNVLDSLGLPVDYLGWTMVVFGSRFWRREVLKIPHARRILLLPHCMRNQEKCPGIFDADGLICRNCGACELGRLQERAIELGYHVLIAEGTPIVMKWILNGKADGILGVGCLPSLERAFEKLQLAGIPAMAVPLLANKCKDSETDLELVREMIETPYLLPDRGTDNYAKSPKTWVHLLRGASKLFEPEIFRSTLPSSYERTANDPMAASLETAFEFVMRGGKYYRPFITLATYDAMNGSPATGEDGPNIVANFPEPLKKIAIAIEIFHKASLVHDDIEDDDHFRYGKPTLHRSHGIPIAINIGDFLLGLGYRLIAEQGNRFEHDGAKITSDILARLAAAHTKLAEGQGAELMWRASGQKELHPSEVLNIYAQKTSPAFDAAVYAGLRAAVSTEILESLEVPISRFSKLIGVAFQIKNDLDDWTEDRFNKKRIGADALSSRPTLLWAFALQVLDQSDQTELLNPVESGIERIRELYFKANVFTKAERLIEKYAERAREAADQVPNIVLRELLYHFIETMIR